ncbi:hypothetical protein LX80_02107 [Hydrotalea sandarakina]|jgi:hypothetical protein|uniref:Outer membrane protein with beta-barrel domain n=2 Tax=Hydrotalea sandarakina TaxID=1004304 RepID=A0A2W7RMB0_9BACT|nr:hypothetical protein LX80_02107 [Hydrotalea sandarakina]
MRLAIMTKKTLITLLIILSFSKFTLGQISIKSVLLGGQVGYYNSYIDYAGIHPNEKKKTAAFNISIGKALKENSVYGLNLTYSPSQADNFYYGTNYINLKIYQYNFGIFYRKYKKLATDFYFFTELGASYINAKQTNTDTMGAKLETIKQLGGQLFLTPGLSYKVLNKLHLEIIIPNIVTIQYIVTKDETSTQQTKQRQFLFNSSLNSSGNGLTFIGVGFHFIL